MQAGLLRSSLCMRQSGGGEALKLMTKWGKRPLGAVGWQCEWRMRGRRGGWIRTRWLGTTPTSRASNGGSGDVLEHEVDTWNCVHVNGTPVDSAGARQWEEQLRAGVRRWGAEGEGRKGVWLTLSEDALRDGGEGTDHADMLAAALRCGFRMHHVMEGARGLVLNLSFVETKGEGDMPGAPSHQVGVGAVVFDRTGNGHEGRLLVVKERSGPLRKKDYWKIPTGVVNEGEALEKAVEREVLEEAGIRARFRGIACVRQAHNIFFHFSDLFFMAVLEAVDPDAKPVPDNNEIMDCRWIPLDEYTQQDWLAKSPIHIAFNSIIERVQQDAYPLLPAHSLFSVWKQTTQTIFYHGQDDEQQEQDEP